jgi:oligopeptide transport system permease protein
MTTFEAAVEPVIAGRSLWQDAWRRLRANRAAVASLIILAVITLASFVGPYFLPWTYDQIDWDHIEALPPDFALGHYFGTDSLGRDLLARTLYGGRVSLSVGVLATLVALVIGVTVGAVSGFIGGKTDQLLMRFVDLLYAVPLTFFVILLMVIFGRNFVLIFLAIGAVEWLTMARIVRGQTLALKRKEFIEAARASGGSTAAIIFRHIVPNVLGVVIVYVTLTIPQVILLESFLSFLGLGVQDPRTSWGMLINDGAAELEINPRTLIIPAMFMTVTLFCFNFLGDGLRDALDPKDR